MIDCWLQALLLPVGLAILTDDRTLLRQQLYRARAEAKNEELEDLIIVFPQADNELWIVRKDAPTT